METLKKYSKKLEGRDFELHKQFSECGMNAKEWLRKCALMLPEIEDRGIWAQLGFVTIFEYAAKLAGMSKWQVYNAIRIVRSVEDKPALKRVIEEKGLSAVSPVIAVATNESQEFWAEKAMELTKNELEVFVRDYRWQTIETANINNSAIDENKNCVGSSEILPRQNPQPVKIPIMMDLTSQTFKQLEKLKGGGTWEDAMQKLLKIRQEEVGRDEPCPVESDSRYIPAHIRRFVIERDNGYCSFPGCTKEYHDIHHVQGFSRDHVHDPSKMFLLCRAHHELSHRGLIENETLAPQYWRVRERADSSSHRRKVDEMVVERRR